jgi:hypothetical protein
MSEDPSYQAQLVFRSGFGAMVVAMFGMGWLGSGLGAAQAFTPVGIVLFDVSGILLLGCSIYFIRKGRSLRQTYATSPETPLRKTNKQLLLVVVSEFVAILIVGKLAYAFRRPDLAPVLAAVVVGLHFLPLGKIFHQATFYFWGMAITLWCVICAMLFRDNTLVVWSNIGTGILLWATCAYILLRARGIMRSLAR